MRYADPYLHAYAQERQTTMPKTTKTKNGKLDLSHLTPEEIARRVLETPPPEKDGKKVKTQNEEKQ